MSDTESAFWAAIGSAPDDTLPRLVFADWLEENAGEVVCPQCFGRWEPLDHGNPIRPPCSRCGGYSGTVMVSDGRAELAEELRATCDRVPRDFEGRSIWGWNRLTIRPDDRDRTSAENAAASIAVKVFDRLTGFVRPVNNGSWRDFSSAAAAIRSLCQAWVEVHRTNHPHPEPRAPADAVR